MWNLNQFSRKKIQHLSRCLLVFQLCVFAFYARISSFLWEGFKKKIPWLITTLISVFQTSGCGPLNVEKQCDWDATCASLHEDVMSSHTCCECARDNCLEAVRLSLYQRSPEETNTRDMASIITSFRTIFWHLINPFIHYKSK